MLGGMATVEGPIVGVVLFYVLPGTWSASARSPSW
jgi:ABC-type branched-subunit amino acid transport system permease subunit